MLHPWKTVRDALPKAKTLEGPPHWPLRIPVLELMCSLDVGVLNLKPFSTLAIDFNYNAGQDEGIFVGIPNLLGSH